MCSLPFLGCDSTSWFYGRSKISTWKMVLNDNTALETFVHLGEEFEVDVNFGHCIYYLQLLTQAEALLMVEIWFIVYSSDKNPACYQVF